jgi:hypothetical protein
MLNGPEQRSTLSSFRIPSVKFEIEGRVERRAGADEGIQIAVIKVRSYLVQHIKGEVKE